MDLGPSPVSWTVVPRFNRVRSYIAENSTLIIVNVENLTRLLKLLLQCFPATHSKTDQKIMDGSSLNFSQPILQNSFRNSDFFQFALNDVGSLPENQNISDLNLTTKNPLNSWALKFIFSLMNSHQKSYTVKLTRAKLPANGGKFTCRLHVKKPHTVYIRYLHFTCKNR